MTTNSSTSSSSSSARVYYQLLIHNRKYLLLWSSLLLSLCGDWFNYVAAISLIKTFVSAEQNVWFTTAFIVARLLPSLFLLPLLGWWTDRFDKRYTMILSNFFRVFLVLVYLLVKSDQTIWILYVVAFCELGLSSFYDPARRGYIPHIVEPEELAIANIIDGVTWSTMMAVGSALGGFITDMIGTSWCFVIDSCCYALATICIFLVTPTTRAEPEKEKLINDETPKSQSVSVEKIGVRAFLRKHPLVALGCFCKMAGAVGWGIMNLIIIEFAQTNWVIGSEGSISLGILLGIRGISELTTPVITETLFIRKEDKSNPQVLFRWALSGFFMEFLGTFEMSWAILSSTGTASPTCIVVFIIGNVIRTAGDANNWCFASAFLATSLLTRTDLMGRIFSFENSTYVVGESLGTVIGAFIQTETTLSFLPYKVRKYFQSVAFMAACITVFNLVAFICGYLRWRTSVNSLLSEAETETETETKGREEEGRDGEGDGEVGKLGTGSGRFGTGSGRIGTGSAGSGGKEVEVSTNSLSWRNYNELSDETKTLLIASPRMAKQ